VESSREKREVCRAYAVRRETFPRAYVAARVR
jgi:hypothetical protein